MKICGLHTIHILTLTLKLNNQFHIATAQEDLGGGQHKSLAVFRAVGRSENSSNLDSSGIHLFPLVGIGLTDLPKSGGAMAPPNPRGSDRPSLGITAELRLCRRSSQKANFLIVWETGVDHH